MANIVLGLAVSHSPQLSMPAETLARLRGERQPLPAASSAGKTWTFDDLVARPRARAPRRAGHARGLRREGRPHRRTASGVLKQTLAEVDPDVLVVIGDDHHEMFTEHLMPTFTVYWGETVNADPAARGEDLRDGEAGRLGAVRRASSEAYAVDAKLGRHILQSVQRRGLRHRAHGRARTRTSRSATPSSPVRTRLTDPRRADEADRPGPRQHLLPAERADAVPLLRARPGDRRRDRVVPRGRSGWRWSRPAASRTSSSTRRSTARCSPRWRRTTRPRSPRSTSKDYVSGTSESLCWFSIAGACSRQGDGDRRLRRRATAPSPEPGARWAWSAGSSA